MTLSGKYIWIWRLVYSENGNTAALIQKARDLGISGYIIKTHDGSNFWQQSSAITEFRRAGLSCGAWGYSYGRNVDGEVLAIRKTVSLQPDFYVLDVEGEYEASGMRNTAQDLLGKLGSLGLPLGYTSFAFPSYHPVPFDIFSRYCDFTMPQIYWAEMGRDVTKAFNMSVSQYQNFGLPVYPLGQITSDVNPEDIATFNNLCAAFNTPVISYWDYQEAGSAQLDALRSTPGLTLQAAVDILAANGLVSTPDYWLQNARSGQTVNGTYAATLIMRMAEKLQRMNQ